MKDEPKPPAPDSRLLAPDSLWNDLVAAEAAGKRAPQADPNLFVVQEILQEHYDQIARYQHFILRAPDGEQILYHRNDVYDAGAHAAYITGIRDERFYQLGLLRKQRERKGLAIGAAFFFGFCAGMILAATMSWLFR